MTPAAHAVNRNTAYHNNLNRITDDAQAHNLTYLIPANFPDGNVPKMTKGWIMKDGVWTEKAADKPGAWQVKQARIESIERMFDFAKMLSRKNAVVIYGQRNETPSPIEYTLNGSTYLTPANHVTRDLEHFDAVARFYVILDVDKSAVTDRDPAVAALKIRALMPLPFHNVACVVGASASHGMKDSARLRIIFMLSRPLFPEASFNFASTGDVIFDPSLKKVEQIIYFRDAYFNGAATPVDFERWHLLPGAARVVVPDDVGNIAPSKERIKNRPADLSMPANTTRGFDHFVDATIRRAAPASGNRKTTVDLMAKDVCQAALDFDVGECLALAYLSPCDETQEDARKAMAEHRYPRAVEAASNLRKAGEAIAEAWGDRKPEDDWSDHAIAAYNGAPWGNYAGEPHRMDDGEDFGVPDLTVEERTNPAPRGIQIEDDVTEQNELAPAVTTDNAQSPADDKPLRKALNRLESTIRLRYPGLEKEADELKQAALAAGDAYAADLAEWVSWDSMMGENIGVYADALFDHRGKLKAGSKPARVDIRGLVTRLGETVTRGDKKQTEHEAVALRRVATESKLFDVARVATDVAMSMRGGKKTTNEGLNLLDVLTKDMQTAAPASALASLPEPWNITLESSIPPRAFVFGKSYIRGYVSLTVAPGGRGKSAFLLSEAVAMACGRDLYGRPCKPLRVYYFNSEDPKDEIDRRVFAILKVRGCTAADLKGRLFTRSGRDHPLKLAEVRDGRPTIREDAKQLESLLRDLKIDVAILDPFVSLHLCSENDTTAVDMIVKELGRIAGKSDAAIMLSHHTRKPGTDGAAEGQITTDDSRGAKALIDGVRDQRLLNPMKVKDAQRYEIEDAERWRFIHVGGGKNNLSPKGPGTWLKLESQGLDNAAGDYEADNVGVVVGWLAPQGVNRGTADQEKIAGWLSTNGVEGEIAAKEVCAGTGIPQKNFRRDVMGSADQIVTSHGLVTYAKPLGKKEGLLRLTALAPDDGAAFCMPSTDDGEADATNEQDSEDGETCHA